MVTHKPQTKKMIDTKEGRILLVGLFMSFLCIGLIGYYAWADVEISQALLLVFAAHTIGGRAAGISICILREINVIWTVFYNFYIEVLIVCFTYSLFVLAIRNHIKLRWLKLFALRLERKARKHKEKIAKYGWIGLFLFVMTPLPVTGPVIGSIIGFLLKFKLSKNLSAVLFGTLAAIVVWTLFFDFLEQHLHLIRYIIGGMIAVILLSYVSTIKNWLADKIQQ